MQHLFQQMQQPAPHLQQLLPQLKAQHLKMQKQHQQMMIHEQQRHVQQEGLRDSRLSHLHEQKKLVDRIQQMVAQFEQQQNQQQQLQEQGQQILREISQQQQTLQVPECLPPWQLDDTSIHVTDQQDLAEEENGAASPKVSL